MSKLIDILKGVSPDSEIVILSIPPVTAAHESENPEKLPVIMDYNSKLEKTAENKDCKYIDIFTMLQDDDGYLASEYAEADGLHFLGKAYGVVLSRIQFELSNENEVTSEVETVTETTAETSVIEESIVNSSETNVTESETITVTYNETEITE